ncbi:MAG: cytidylate kinase-like family protein [Ruminococcus sp.]|nr:cytidylate kinase-like family protein [Ruminococcus sp.]
MQNKIVTISRQFGSGGRAIGKRLAETLEVPCYDVELIDKIAQESGFAKEYLKESGEYRPYSNWFFNAFTTGQNGSHMTNQDYIWNIQKKNILELAEREPCVIVGRCADYILRDAAFADCLKVFIHASLAYRAQRIVQVYGEQEVTPEKRLKDKDKRRSAYYQYYTDMKFGDCRNYHLALDSSAFGLDKCVELIAAVY